MSRQRPEWIKCIKHTHADYDKEAWCGREILTFDWVFQDIDHAAYATMSGARQVPCPDCVNEVVKALKDE
jgi:hypothetical protein